MAAEQPAAREAGAYQMLRQALTLLMQAEADLAMVQQAAPDPELAARLLAIQSAVIGLIGVVPLTPSTG